MNTKTYLILSLTLLLIGGQMDLHAQNIEDPSPPRTESQSKSKSAPKKAFYGQRNLLYGYYTENEWIIPPVYSKLDKEYSDFMIATKNGKLGVIDRVNTIIVPFQYDKIYKKFKDFRNWDNREWTGLYFIEKAGKKGVMDRNGNIKIPAKYESLNRIEKNLYSVGGKDIGYGLVDLENNTILDFNYEAPIFAKDNTKTVYQTKKNGKYGWIKLNGDIVLPFEYDELAGIRLSEKGYVKYKQGSKLGFMALDGKILTPPLYDYYTFKIWAKDLLKVSIDKKYGILDSDLKEKVPLIYSEIERLSQLYLKVRVGDNLSDYKFGVIDTLGKVILDLNYNRYIVASPSNLIFAQRLDETNPHIAYLYAIYDNKGKQIRPPQYTSVSNVGCGYLAVTISRKNADQERALMNPDLKVITPYTYHRFDVRKKEGSDKVTIYAETRNTRCTLKPNGRENNDHKRIR